MHRRSKTSSGSYGSPASPSSTRPARMYKTASDLPWIAVMFTQRQDRRPPRSGVSSQSTSSASAVYGRIVDFLGDAACEVNADGWPVLADPGATVLAPCP